MSLPVATAALPAELTSFVGREGEVDRALALIAEARLVTLTGPGGVGKTRLALRVARAVDRPTADAVVLVELDAVADPALVLATVATSLGLRDDGGSWSLADLCGYLGDRPLLLVVDNCEHLLDECARVVGALLAGATRLRVLATSRRPLGLPGEVLVSVPALPTPASAESVPEVLAATSVALLVQRARAAVADFAVHAGNAVDVVRLCQRLEGIPLAIELAAARLRVLGLTQLLTRLDDHLEILAAGPRTVEERQRTMTATVAWSYDLCTPAEQRAWERLSVFDGGFSLEAAEYVCADDDSSTGQGFDLVAGLVDHSVLAPEEERGSVRYRMLETVRAYGLRQLASAGTEAPARERHRDWFRAMTAAARRDWFAPGQAELLDRLHADAANLRAAMQLSVERGEPEVALAMATDVWFYWFSRGSLEEGRHWVTSTLSALPDGAAEVLRVRAGVTVGMLALNAGDETSMQGALLAAAHAAQVSADPGAQVDGLRAEAYLAAARSELATVWDLSERFLAADTEATDPEAAALVLQMMAAAATDRGDAQGAALAIRRGLALSAAHGEEWCHQIMLVRDAEERIRLGELGPARDAASRSLVLASGLRHRFGALSAIEMFVWIAAITDEPALAAELYGALSELWQTVGVPATGPALPFPLYQEAVDSALSAADPGLVASALARGRLLSYDEVVACCLGEPVPVAGRPRQPSAAAAPGTLTARELEIAEFVARGLTNKQIAATLVISPRTAEGHVQRILDKLGYTSRASIAYWVVERRASQVGGSSAVAVGPEA